jgi:hypothetical protein
MHVDMRRPNTNAREEVAVRPVLIWLLGVSIAVVIVPYLFYMVYQWQ